MLADVIDAVIFDWGGTLTPWHVIDAPAMWRTVAARIDPTRAHDLGAALLAAEDALWLRSRDEHRSATLAEVWAAAGVTPSADVLAGYHAMWDPHSYLDPDVPALFAGLRAQGIRVGVLSNTIWPRAEHERIFARDGILEAIDAAVYTSEIPWTKPHPEAFRAAMDAVGVDDPSRCVYVGDRLFDDIYGAQNAGMLAVHVPHSTIPAQQIGHTVGEPDAVVQRLGDLLAVLDEWRHQAA